MSLYSRRIRLGLIVSLSALNIVVASAQQGLVADNPTDLMRVGNKVIKVNEAINMVQGFGNTFMITTSEGNVIIDASIAVHAGKHHELLTAENKAPIKYIILTHGHGDHIGGVQMWREAGTQIIAQKNYAEFQHYQTRLGAFYAKRNAAQFGTNLNPRAGEAWAGNYAGKIEPTILFDDKYELTLGGLKFEIYSTPGETYDHLTIQGCFHRRQLLRIVSEHLHVARNSAAMGSGLCQFTQ